MSTAAYSWEFTVLRRPDGAGKARVAGRILVEAPSADEAKRQALAELANRSDEAGRWSLGVLRPLTPKAPGTALFRATFAIWVAQADEFVRQDVHELEVWAEDASAARRIAQQEIQKNPDYVPAWRIREVSHLRDRRRRSR